MAVVSNTTATLAADTLTESTSGLDSASTQEHSKVTNAKEHRVRKSEGPGSERLNAKSIEARAASVPMETLLTDTGRKFVELEKAAYSKETRLASTEADLVGLLADRLPVLAKLTLKEVAGWIQEARSGAHNYQAHTTYLQDPLRATSPTRTTPANRDSYRQLAYRRMTLARITAAVGGKLSPTGKPLFRKSEAGESVRSGLTLSDGKTYLDPVQMLAQGWSLRKTLQVWSDALHPKVKNLRELPRAITFEAISDMVPGIKVGIKTTEQDGNDTIEVAKKVSVETHPEALADLVLALLDRAIAYTYGPKIGNARLSKMQDRVATLFTQTPQPTEAAA